MRIRGVVHRQEPQSLLAQRRPRVHERASNRCRVASHSSSCRSVLTKQRRLLISTTDFPPGWGGIQRLVFELATRLGNGGWAVTVLAPHAEAGLSAHGQGAFALQRTGAAWGDSRVRCLAQMARMAAVIPADVRLAAHVNALPAFTLARPVVPRVVLLYGSELWAPASRTIARVFGNGIDHAMAISRFTAEEAGKLRVAGGRVAVTPPGASPPAHAPDMEAVLRRLGLLEEGRVLPYFLTVSRLDEPHKGHDVLVRALPRIVDRYPEVRYVIVGDGRLAPTVREMASAEGVADAVVMTGAVGEDEKGALMRSCLAYAMVSRAQRRPALFEGFGIAYLEAALAGRPSIAGASGGVADAVVDGETGLLVDPTSVEQIVDAALSLLDDPRRADALGAAGRRRAEIGFTWDAAVARMERVLLGVLR